MTTTAALVIYFDDQATSSTVTGTVELGPTSLNALESITVTMGQVTVTGGLTDVQLRASAVTVGGTVTVGNSLTVSSLPAISGTVTINNFPSTQLVEVDGGAITVQNGIEEYISSYGSFPISGTVTANPTGTQTIAGSVTLGAGTNQIGSVTASISGTVPISISSVTVGNSVTIGSLPAISGTVTANSSNGSLTTRFGSVTTANTAFATSAVTNASRKYLLIQNVTTASNVITVGIGFTPTTTQGIQLSSGAGLTFEGSYIPTGAVNLLSSVTASCFTILEA